MTGESLLIAEKICEIVVNQEYKLEVIRRLGGAIRQKRTELWKNQEWILHHDNAPTLCST